MILIVGGRIHQQDNHAQNIVSDLIDQVMADKDLNDQIFFLDNFLWVY